MLFLIILYSDYKYVASSQLSGYLPLEIEWWFDVYIK